MKDELKHVFDKYMIQTATCTLEQWIDKQPLYSTIKKLEGGMLHSNSTNEIYVMEDSND